MANQTPLQVGQHLDLKGCFTEEFFLRGLTLSQIGVELGLPSHRLNDGVFIAFAIRLPSIHEFDLGGWAEYATDNFIEYKNGKSTWNEQKFEQTYDGKRMPISIEAAKKAWRENMKNEKLIKILPKIAHQQNDFYPPGGKASQIIISKPVKCHVVKFLNRGEVFNSVWN